MELNAPSFVENASMSSGPSTNAGRHIPNSPAPEANAAIFPRAAAASPSAIPAAIASASAYEPGLFAQDFRDFPALVFVARPELPAREVSEKFEVLRGEGLVEPVVCVERLYRLLRHGALAVERPPRDEAHHEKHRRDYRKKHGDGLAEPL